MTHPGLGARPGPALLRVAVSVEPVVIVGVSIPRVARRVTDCTSFSLLLECVQEALADAGLDARRRERRVPRVAGSRRFAARWSSNWARRAGTTFNWVLEHGLDAIGIRGVLNVAAAYRAGLCETVLVGAAVATGPTIPAGVPDGAAAPGVVSPAISWDWSSSTRSAPISPAGSH